MTLDKNSKTFMVYIATLKTYKMTIYLSQTAQIAALQWTKDPIKTLI